MTIEQSCSQKQYLLDYKYPSFFNVTIPPFDGKPVDQVEGPINYLNQSSISYIVRSGSNVYLVYQLNDWRLLFKSVSKMSFSNPWIAIQYLNSEIHIENLITQEKQKCVNCNTNNILNLDISTNHLFTYNGLDIILYKLGNFSQTCSYKNFTRGISNISHLKDKSIFISALDGNVLSANLPTRGSRCRVTVTDVTQTCDGLSCLSDSCYLLTNDDCIVVINEIYMDSTLTYKLDFRATQIDPNFDGNRTNLVVSNTGRLYVLNIDTINPNVYFDPKTNLTYKMPSFLSTVPGFQNSKTVHSLFNDGVVDACFSEPLSSNVTVVGGSGVNVGLIVGLTVGLGIPFICLILILIFGLIYWRFKYVNDKKVDIELAPAKPYLGAPFLSNDFPTTSLSQNMGSSGFIPSTTTSNSTEQSVEADLLVNNYNIKHKLGEGGEGSVYLAEDLKRNKLVALKLVESEETDVNAFKEAFTQLKIKHEHLVPVLDAFFTRLHGLKYVVLVLPYYENGDLKKLLKQRQDPFPENLIRSILLQLCKVLNFMLKEEEYIHGDIKPQNILVENNTVDDIFVVLADFGLARKVATQDDKSITMTRQVGTSSYMAPETLMRGKTSYKTDIYALGCTMYQLMTLDFQTCISELFLNHTKEEARNLLIDRMKKEQIFSDELINLIISMVAMKAEDRPNYEQMISLLSSSTSNSNEQEQ
ncbi:hypothetical protein ABK040_008229 [Willaertia magna]